MANDLQTNLDIIDDFTQRLQVAVIGAEETTAKHEHWVEGTSSEVIQTINGPIKTLRGLIADWDALFQASFDSTIEGYDSQFAEKLVEYDDDFLSYLLNIGFEPAEIYQGGITLERRSQTVAYDGVTYYWAGALPFTTTGVFANEADWLIAPIVGGIEIPQISFATGGNLVRKTQSVLGTDGEWYFWTGAFPKTIPVASTLESTGGVGLNKFKLASGHVPVRPMMKILSTAAGYALNAGSFEYGATITSSSQVLPELNTGRIWKWDGPIPKVVDLNSSPASSGGVGENLWNEVVTATGSSGTGITIGATKPTGVGSGHRWFCTTDGRTYVYFADGDSVQWVEESPQNSVFDGLEPRVRESLRRSYAEAGYNLVVGSFEAGGMLVNANDVLLHEATGEAFSGPAGTVAAGTIPSSGGFIDRSVSHRVVYLSKYSTLSDAIGKNRLTRSLKVIVDKDTTETSQVAFSGDLEISGKGVVTMQNGMTALINHSSGSVKVSRGVKFRSLDTSSTNSIFAVISTNFTDVDVSATIERVGIKAQNVITNVFGKVKFDGVILGDFTAISTPVNDGIIFVEAASELNVDGMTNLSVGSERVIKCSHSVETFSMQHAKMRGSTKRQVVDTYIDTKKVVCRNNDVEMSAFEVFIEGKLKTEPDLPGVYPAQVSVDISRNVFKIGLDQCNRIALFQASGGTPSEPSNYDSLFVAEDNIIGGRTSSTTFDVRGFTEYKERGTVYRNGNLVVRPAVNVISCNKIDIDDILADSYSVNIAGTGSSQGGINYNRSPVNISIGDVTAKYSNTGFVFLNNCNAVDKLAVNECKLVEDTTSPASTGLIYVANSNITSLKCLDNESAFNTSIPVRTSGTVTIGKRVISGNSWQRDSIAFSSQSIANGASVRFAFANINGNYTGATERFTVSHSEDLKGCTICGYKEGATLYAEIYNYTGASVTIDAGMIYIDIAALQ